MSKYAWFCWGSFVGAAQILIVNLLAAEGFMYISIVAASMLLYMMCLIGVSAIEMLIQLHEAKKELEDGK